LAGGPVPDGHSAAVHGSGEVAAVGAVGQVVYGHALALGEGMQRGSGPGVPDEHRAVLGARGDLPAIGAERGAVERAVVPEGGRVAVAPPLEVVPLPATQVLRASVEQLLGPGDVAGRLVTLCQGNECVVEVSFQL